MGRANAILESLNAQPVSEEVADGFAHYVDEQLTEAESLANGKWSNWVSKIDDPYKAAVTAQALENQQAYIGQLPKNFIMETTLMGDPGIAVNPDLAFPLIRAIMPNLAATELFSTQPMNSPYGLIFYLQFVYGSDKGATKRGQLLFDYPDKTYSSETIKNEPVQDLTADAGPFNHVAAYHPIRPGTLTLSGPASVGGTTLTITDDGAGTIGGGTVDYASGVVTGASFGANVTGAVKATYQWNSEGSDKVPQVDLLLTSLPVNAETHKLRTRVSSEANINLKRVHGLDAVQELGNVSGELIKYDIDRKLIDMCYQQAAAGSVSFDVNPQPGVNYKEHIQNFTSTLLHANQLIFKATQRCEANWVLCGVDVATIIEDLPGFVPSGIQGVRGIRRIGTLNGRWTVYKDPQIGDANFLVGYKGTSFLETGLIYCPYIPFFMTPPTVLDDFIIRQGVGSQFGVAMANPRMYVRGRLTGQ